MCEKGISYPISLVEASKEQLSNSQSSHKPKGWEGFKIPRKIRATLSAEHSKLEITVMPGLNNENVTQSETKSRKVVKVKARAGEHSDKISSNKEKQGHNISKCNGFINKSSVLNPLHVSNMNKRTTENNINKKRCHSESRGPVYLPMLKENKVASLTDRYNTKQNDTTVINYICNNNTSRTYFKSKVLGEQPKMSGRCISQPQNGLLSTSHKQSKTVKGKTLARTNKVPEEVTGVKLAEKLAKRKSRECKSGGRSWSSRARRNCYKLGSDRYPNPRPDRIYNIDVDGHDIDAYDL